MQIPLCGQAYLHASQDVNNQRCMNWFVTPGGDSGRGDPVLLPTPGLKTLVDGSGLQVRGMVLFDTTPYVVIDGSFYEMSINKVAQTASLTSRGTLGSTSGRVQMTRNASQVMIIDSGNNGYTYTPSTTTFAEITDVDFYGGVSLVFIDNYFFYNVPDTDDIYATAIGDGGTISALDVISAEAMPDNLVGLGVDKRELWAFGTQSVQVFYDAANPTGFPFSTRDGAFVDIGCSAANSIVSANNSLYWLDSRRYVVRNQGYDVEIVSTDAINSSISEYSVVSDAFAFAYTELGRTFYAISFPTAKRTWVLDTTLGSWHEWGYWSQNNEFEHHLANCYLYVDGWHIVGDRQSGKIYRLSRDYLDDAGFPIHRIRTTPFLSSGFQELTVNTVELLCEVGKGQVTGLGSDPQIMMRYSQDGGYTWSSETARSLGALGNYAQRITWNRLGSGREWLAEFRVHANVKLALIAADADISQ